MGYWDTGIFDNDVAMDWIYDLTEQEDSELIANTIYSNYHIYQDNPDEDLDMDEASEALASAEVVAILSGSINTNIPEELNEWLKGKVLKTDQLKKMAKSVVISIRDKSELREAWNESDSFHEWLNTIEDLIKRLS
jgi:hypothetical protein